MWYRDVETQWRALQRVLRERSTQPDPRTEGATHTMSDRDEKQVHVVVAGESYSHGPPRAVFDHRRDAEAYAEGVDADWTKVELTPLNPEVEND